jgi:hypothetical protein
VSHSNVTGDKCPFDHVCTLSCLGWSIARAVVQCVQSCALSKGHSCSLPAVRAKARQLAADPTRGHCQHNFPQRHRGHAEP